MPPTWVRQVLARVALAALVLAVASCSLILKFDEDLDAGGNPGTDARADSAAAPPDAPPAADALFAADAAPVADARVPPCTGGDRQALAATGHCYLLFQTGASWDAARAACLALVPPAHLVAVADNDENLFIAPVAALLPVMGSAQDMWMGGNDIAAEMAWEWSTAEPWGYTSWRASTSEPNNGGAMGNEDCSIMLGAENGLWDDRPCDRVYPYMCERDPP